jgi:hypothetical protein
MVRTWGNFGAVCTDAICCVGYVVMTTALYGAFAGSAAIASARLLDGGGFRDISFVDSAHFTLVTAGAMAASSLVKIFGETINSPTTVALSGVMTWAAALGAPPLAGWMVGDMQIGSPRNAGREIGFLLALLPNIFSREQKVGWNTALRVMAHCGMATVLGLRLAKVQRNYVTDNGLFCNLVPGITVTNAFYSGVNAMFPRVQQPWLTADDVAQAEKRQSQDTIIASASDVSVLISTDTLRRRHQGDDTPKTDQSTNPPKTAVRSRKKKSPAMLKALDFHGRMLSVVPGFFGDVGAVTVSMLNTISEWYKEWYHQDVKRGKDGELPSYYVY